MEIIVGILAFFAGATCFVAGAFLVVGQLIWGIVDVASSERHSGAAKATIILITVFLLGPIMTFFYACFGTHSRVLQRTTIGAVIVFVISGTSVLGLAAMHSATQSRLSNLLDRNGGTAIHVDADTVTAGELDLGTFTAVHYVPLSSQTWSVAVADFNVSGPLHDSGVAVTVPSIYPLNQIAIDSRTSRTYGITTHTFGYIVPATGHFVEIETDPSLPDLSWPSAIAYDDKNGRVIVVGRGAAFAYDPATGAWQSQPAFDGLGLISMTYDAEAEVFYGLVSEFGRDSIDSIVRLDGRGTVLGATPLQHKLAAAELPDGRVQLLKPGRWLVILVSAHYRRDRGAEERRIEQRLYVVDPDKGDVALVRS